jgi:glucosamine--fructose-6-phosphate aminotransferase (isomerizing)
MPVVTVAPNDALMEKLKSNMQEVRARGGQLCVCRRRLAHHLGRRRACDPPAGTLRLLSPILHVVSLQLLAYHTAWRAAPTWTSRATWPSR